MDEYTAPLSESEVRHLLRRTCFGAPPAEVEALAGQTAGEIVGNLLQSVGTVPLPAIPAWVNTLPPPRGSSAQQRAAFNSLNAEWRTEMMETWILQMAQNRFRERLTLFWHDHFVTSYEEYFYSAWGYRYLTTLRTHAFGNFKDFVHAIGIDAAMLVYLDGYINNGNAPNENYARELLELFTMGHYDLNGNPNYSESDIQEIAKALSGWVIRVPTTWDVEFYYPAFDDGVKTFLGQTGEFGYSDVIDTLFEERSEQIAQFIAGKLVAEFVYREPPEALIIAVAEAFLNSGFQLVPALRVLFTSQAFFDPAHMGGREKSPIEFCVGHAIELEVKPDADFASYARRAAITLGQVLFNPPNVAGWPGHRNWISTNTLPTRWGVSATIVRQLTSEQDIIAFGEAMTPSSSQHESLHLALSIAQHVFAVPMEWVEVPELDEPFEGDLANLPLPDWFLNGPAYHRNLVKMFLIGLPWYEWNLNIGGASDRIVQYVVRLSQLPEYQLM